MSAERFSAHEVRGQVAYPFEQRRLTESELRNALLGTEAVPVSTPPLLVAVCLRLSCPWWVCEVAQEVHTFLSRIQTLVWLRTIPLLGLGPAMGQDAIGRLVICTRTCGRRLGIHSFQNTHCQSSLADQEIFLAGWMAAARWCDLYPHVCVSHNGADLTPCMSIPPRRCKSVCGNEIITPETSITPQGSKHDRSTPPASQESVC